MQTTAYATLKYHLEIRFKLMTVIIIEKSATANQKYAVKLFALK